MIRFIMTKAVLLAGLCLLSAPGALADTRSCRSGCPTAYLLISVSETRSYGLLITAPEVGCRRVRYRIEDQTAAFLGHTPPLAPGELAVVRMGRGFAEGDHKLTIASEGCTVRPAATRRVTLAKLSPDHGWRDRVK
jgi:hypothetical protein